MKREVCFNDYCKIVQQNKCQLCHNRNYSTIVRNKAVYFGFLCLLASQTVNIFAHGQTCIILFFQKYLKRWITEILHCKMLK